jgi:hypothetical protein
MTVIDITAGKAAFLNEQISQFEERVSRLGFRAAESLRPG